jgi:pyruvate dehydrogenase E1 component
MRLSTDGSGRSDTHASLRKFFEVDRDYIVIAPLASLWVCKEVTDVLACYDIPADSVPPWRL